MGAGARIPIEVRGRNSLSLQSRTPARTTVVVVEVVVVVVARSVRMERVKPMT